MNEDNIGNEYMLERWESRLAVIDKILTNDGRKPLENKDKIVIANFLEDINTFVNNHFKDDTDTTKAKVGKTLILNICTLLPVCYLKGSKEEWQELLNPDVVEKAYKIYNIHE